MTGKGTYKANIEYHRKYRKEHSEQRKAQARKWRQEHPNYNRTEKYRQYQKDYRQTHSEENKEYAKEWREQHPEYQEHRKQWQHEHPEITRVWRINSKHSDEAKKQRLLRQAKWREQNQERIKIYTHINHHEKSYPLAEACEFCEEKESLVRHHPDYDYPEIYVTCCSMCHQWIHRIPIYYPIVPLAS